MKIGVVVDNEFNSDIRVQKEVDILVTNGFEVFVLCFDFGSGSHPDYPFVVDRIRLRKIFKDLLFLILNRVPIYNLLWNRRIKKFIIKYDLEIMHVHDLYMSKPAHLGIKASKRNIPLVLDLHENFPVAITLYNWTKGVIRGFLSDPKRWKRKELEYLSYADTIITLSDSFKKKLQSEYKELKDKQFVSYPNVINLKQFEKFEIDHSILKKPGVTFFYFGGVAERRGIFETLQVFDKAISKYSDINLLIIGPVDKYDKERFFGMINSCVNKANIEFIPWIELDQLMSYLNIVDVCLSPLHKNDQHESGVANKIYQYMFGKKPLIVSNCIPQMELVETYECGLSYSDNEEYLSSILELYENENLRLKMGMNGYNALYYNYNSESFENQLIGIYSKIQTD